MDRIEQLLHGLRAMAQSAPSETLQRFARDLADVLLTQVRTAAQQRLRRLALLTHLERLAAAEAAFRRAHDQGDPRQRERCWRAMARAGDAARVALARDHLQGLGMRPAEEPANAG